MPVVTLTSDLGLQDYYIPVLKASMLQHAGDLNFVDISHNIRNYDIVQAAFVFKNAYPHFPAGTIHVLCVNHFDDLEQRYLAIRHEDQYFIGPDNGIFSLIFEELPEEIFFIECFEHGTFPFKKVFSDAVRHILSGAPFGTIGAPVTEIVRRLALQPVIGPAHIRGLIIHIDNFENLIVNINRFLFDKVCNDRDYAVFFKRHDPLTFIHQHYSDVPVGEIVCLFNSAHYLEIAINMGKAASMLGLKIEDTIQVEFKEAGDAS